MCGIESDGMNFSQKNEENKGRSSGYKQLILN